MGHSHGPDGAHTHGNGGSGLGALLLAILGLALVASIAGPVVHAVAELVRVVLIAAAVILGLGLACGIALVAWRLRQGWVNRPRLVATVPPGLPKPAQALPAPPRSSTALPARPTESHLHLHGMSAEQVAEVIRQARPVHGPSGEHPPAIEED